MGVDEEKWENYNNGGIFPQSGWNGSISVFASTHPDQSQSAGHRKPTYEIQGAPRENTTSLFTRICDDLEHLVSELDVPADPSLLSNSQSQGTTFPAVKRAQVQKKAANLPEVHASSSLVPTRSLWIGNLDMTISEEELYREFERFGTIDSLRLLPSKECAFVNYLSVEEAVRARDMMQGKALGNMIVRIGFGKPDTSTSTSAVAAANEPHPGHSILEPSSHSRSVWVGHIGPDMSLDTLYSAFSQFGQIESCRILDTKNCAFVNFYSVEDAFRARKVMNGARIGTALVKTGFARSSSSGTTKIDAPYSGAESTTVPFPVPQKVTTYKFSLAKSYPTSLDKLHGIDGDEDDGVTICTQELSNMEFKQQIPELPENLTLPIDLNPNAIRECRRMVEHFSATVEEIDTFSQQIIEHILAASIDPIGNILVQKLIERGSDSTRSQILHRLGIYVATIGVHKNGTWVIQKLINNCHTPEQRHLLVEKIRPHVVPLMQDQFGNYVVQCCLAYGPAMNQFVFEALYHRCLDIGTSRFGSRAMRSCLESSFISRRQQKFVAMALINHALTLVHDPNGVIIIQLLLDSDLPGRYAFIAPVLKGHFSSLCLSKHASSIVAKLIQPSADPSARDAVVDELLVSPSLSNLLQEPMSATIILKSLTTTPTAQQKIKIAHALKPQLAKLSSLRLPHLRRICEETDTALSLVRLEIDEDPESNESFSRTLVQNRTLLSHAVGGPVFNSNSAGRFFGHHTENNSAMISKSFSTQQNFSFGSHTTAVPASPEPIAKKNVNYDRLSFGPSLLQRFDVQIDRPPTPS